MQIFRSLRDFLSFLELKQDLKKVIISVNPYLEMTEIADRTLKRGGPALLFANPTGYSMPVLCNLFGTIDRIIFGMGKSNVDDLRDVGKLLAFFKAPDPPQGFRDFLDKISQFRHIFCMPTKRVTVAPCQEQVYYGQDVDLNQFPIMHCWPDDVTPLITWGLVITTGPEKKRQNIGVYRQQIISKNSTIIRWMPHRGGALDFREWCKYNSASDDKFPVSVVLGADPAMLLSAVVPIPDTMSEYALSGLFRGCKTEVVKCISCDLEVPANAEIILEGYLKKNNIAAEGPFGDHTGYYNSIDYFPVFTITHITKRSDAIYHSTYTGRPLDEPSVLAMAMNELFIPILQKQFPEIIDFYLPPEGCSYRLAIVTINKKYIGHSRQIMFGIWSFLRQFMYIKFIIVCDDDIDARNWSDVVWAISTRVDPIRDIILIENTPIDYLDFSSKISGLGSKMGIDATNKWVGETQREWGIPVMMNVDIKNYVDNIWDSLGIFKK